MPRKVSKAKTRQHEHRLEIDASPQQVWDSITREGELKNWFPLQAYVEPGEGGEITYVWEHLSNSCRIQVWDPPRHLQTSWQDGVGLQERELGAGPLLVDWFLTGSGGKTRLRLVHSGFGLDSDWDEEFDGTERGWSFELQSLRHYLEHHRGKRRSAYVVRKPVALDAAATWGRLLNRRGLVQWPGSGLQAGDGVEFTLSSGDQVQGTVLQYAPPWEFSFTVDNLNRALMRVSYETCFGGPEALVWVSRWDVSPAEDQALRERLVRALDALFK